MQRPSDAKREAILSAAACLFGAHPYHDVRQEDVADKAGVGKGTLYVYYPSKEALYLAVARHGFTRLAVRVSEHPADSAKPTRDRLAMIIHELTGFAAAYPDLHTVMRTQPLGTADPEVEAARASLANSIQTVIDQGNARGEVADPSPSTTARIILSFARGLPLFPADSTALPELGNHLVRLIWSGIGRSRPAPGEERAR